MLSAVGLTFNESKICCGIELMIAFYKDKYCDLKTILQQVQEARQNHDDDAVKKAVNEYDEALERYEHSGCSGSLGIFLSIL